MSNNKIDILYNVVKLLNNLKVEYKISENTLLYAELYNNFRNAFEIIINKDKIEEFNKLLKIVDYSNYLGPLFTVETTNVRLLKCFDNPNFDEISIKGVNKEEDLELNTKYTEIYQIKDEKFYGNSIEGILKDKISAISTQKVSRRFKDVVDLYIIFKTLEFSDEEVIKKLNKYKTGDFKEYNSIETIRTKELFKDLNIFEGNDIEDIYSYIGNKIDKLNKIGEKLKWQWILSISQKRLINFQ